MANKDKLLKENFGEFFCFGSPCDGKYAACTCGANYVWDDLTKMCQLAGLKDGLYYCKGVVIGVEVPSKQIIALHDLSEKMNLKTAVEACASHSFCDNEKGILPTSRTPFDSISTVSDKIIANGGEKPSGLYWLNSVYSDSVYYLYNTGEKNTNVMNENGLAKVRCVIKKYNY